MISLRSTLDSHQSRAWRSQKAWSSAVIGTLFGFGLMSVFLSGMWVICSGNEQLLDALEGDAGHRMCHMDTHDGGEEDCCPHRHGTSYRWPVPQSGHRSWLMFSPRSRSSSSSAVDI